MVGAALSVLGVVEVIALALALERGWLVGRSPSRKSSSFSQTGMNAHALCKAVG